MATYSVSNSSQLKNALGNARGGDTIKLSGGSYGSLSVTKKFSGNVTISGEGSAKFSGVTLKGAGNLTIDNVTFSGGGLKVSGSSNITIANSDFRDIEYGATFRGSSGITVKNNYVTEMTYDAFRFAGVNNVTITGNTYQERGSKPGLSHKDFIQFWTEGAGPSSKITITNNKFYADDGSTHGIFMNGSKYSGGTYKDVYIANNYFKSSHTHGITVAHGNDVEIRNNTLIKDGKYPPLINVTPDSTNVKIIGNTAPSVPNSGNSSWVISGNKETGGGTHWTGGQRGSPVANTGDSAGASLDAEAAGSFAPEGVADEGEVFRFSGGRDQGGTRNIELDFDGGDTLVLANFDRGTFKGAGKSGSYASIDALAELKALDKASGDVSISTRKGDLVIEIDQGDATHKIALADMAQDFFAL